MRILITGCSSLSKELIDALKDNPNKEEIFVIGINNNSSALLRKNVDIGFVVPPITDKNYIPTVIDICKKYKIQIIVPYITKELPLLSKNLKFFEKNKIKVSVANEKSLAIVNNKISLYEYFSKYMPPQIVARKIEDVDYFCKEYEDVCCKIDNACGGVGFSVVDDKKAYDIALVNKSGMPRYVTKEYLKKNIENGNRIILQKYIKGVDYSSCALADGNNVISICGYYGYEMSNGCVIDGEIKKNKKAYHIHKEIIESVGLDGNSCADFIVSGDNVYLLEINPRVNGSLPFIWKAGGNFLYDRCRLLLGYKDNVEYNFKYGLRMKKYYEAEYF